MKMRYLLSVAALFAAVPIQAAVVTASLADINLGPSATYPHDYGAVGTFSYVIPNNAVISSALLRGTYGTALFSTSTAGFDAAVDGALVTVCVPNDPGCWQTGPAFRPFSIALPNSVFANLLDGSAFLDIIQTNPNTVRFGTPTLEITYGAAAVPELATWAMMIAGFGIAGIALRANRRKVQFALA